VIYALQVQHKELSEAEIEREIRKLLLKIKEGDFETKDSENGRRHPIIAISGYGWLKVAAVLVLVISTFFLLFNRNHTPSPGSYQAFTRGQKSKAVEIYNSHSTEQLLTLPDKSTVLLAPKSRVSYAADFTRDKREIYLVGEAFFTVSKDAAHPFYVYSNDIVTKVLGTSFRVKAFEGTQTSQVIVRTGKVSVFKKKNFTNADAKPGELGGTVLLPNQQVVFNRETGSLNKTIVDQPVPLVDATQTEFVFSETPIKEVFEKLETIYGIRIITDDETISGCTISARFGSESFYQKLDLICKSLNATYEMVDGDIVITSLGCK
jgi:ferric-dicitrate binding protein FerR (iron transport regulator)